MTTTNHEMSVKLRAAHEAMREVERRLKRVEERMGSLGREIVAALGVPGELLEGPSETAMTRAQGRFRGGGDEQ